jgi:hypothetical protein
MIEFEHNALQISHQITRWKGYDNANTPKWTLEIEPFIVQWIVQTKENMHEVKVVGDHMPPWNVVGKGRCYCQLMLRLQKGKDIDQP